MRILIDGQTVVWKQARLSVWKPGLQAQRPSRRFLVGAGIGCLTTLGVGVGFFCPTPDVQLDHFFYITLLNWEFLLKWYNFF